MQYSELVLDLPLETALEAVGERVSGVRSIPSDGSVVFKTNTGVTVAILTSVSDDGDRTRLRYRTTMISPSMAGARATARQIRNVLVEHTDA